MPEPSSCQLNVRSLVSGYGTREVLKGVSIDIPGGEVTALIGHNGAGKSTILRAIFGLIPIWGGEVAINGEIVKKPNPRSLLSAGVAYVPQGNRVFGDLTVLENLEMAGVTLANKKLIEKGIERTFTLFPRLKSRLKQRAGDLSGGEKQMLALSNALVLTPRVLLLDEPSLGLAPQLVSEALARIQEISRHSGVTILIVEQKVREVLAIAHQVYTLRNGRVSFSGLSAELQEDQKLREVYF